jgi:hypothetical protein
MVLLGFAASALAIADLNYDDKKVKLKELIQYPETPASPGEIGKKDFDKAEKRVTISHKAKIGGAGGFAKDMLKGTFGVGGKSSFEDYEIKVKYTTWDMIVKGICRESNIKMLTEEQTLEMLEEAKEDYNSAERFLVGFAFPDNYAGDADIENWNVLMFDESGNRYESVGITQTGGNVAQSGYKTWTDATGKEQVTGYIVNQYLVEFPKVAEKKGKIELVIAGGATEDKRLGFRWVFDGDWKTAE